MMQFLVGWFRGGVFGLVLVSGWQLCIVQFDCEK
jgi:hypothetical protein